MPITSLQASLAPRDAASITPPMPPQTSTAPASATPRPTSSARAASSWSGAPLPITAICGRRLTSPLAAEGPSADALIPPLDARAVAQPSQVVLEPPLRASRRAVDEPATPAQVPHLEGIPLQVVALHLGGLGVGALVGLQVGHAVVLGVERCRGPDRGEPAGGVVVRHEHPVFAEERASLRPAALIRYERHERPAVHRPACAV